MQYKTFSTLYNEALEYDDIEMYIGERGWQEWMNCYETNEVVNILNSIYELSNKNIRSIREGMGLSRQKFCDMYDIKLRTLEDWEYEKSSIPKHTLKLIAYTIFIAGK